MSPNGLPDLGGWRLRIFLTPGEAGAFAETLAAKPWRVETGQYEEGEDEASAALVRRFCAEVAGVAERQGRH